MTLTSAQLCEVVKDAYECKACAQGWYLLGNTERAKSSAATARHARRRLRAHVRERRRRLRAALDAAGRNIIGRMLADQLLKNEVRSMA